MIAHSNQQTCPASIFHESADTVAQQASRLRIPKLEDSDAEFLLGLNEILDELNPTSDHGPLSDLSLHLHS